MGGLIPWLLQNNEEMPHVGTLDIDLGLDPSALADGEYANLIQLLQGQGYRQRDDLRQFQLVRELPQEDGSSPIEVVVDFLRWPDAVRDEVLARLLSLNAERSAEEVAMGLHSKGAKQVAKDASAVGASGARRGRPPRSVQVGETVASKGEQMGLGL